MSNIIPLPTARGASTWLDLFLRLGETHYAQAATLYAEGKLPVRRAMFDASKVRHQLDFLKTLRDELKRRSGQTQDQAAVSLSERLAKQAQRNEKIRSSLGNLHSVRGLDKPRAPAAYLSDHVRSASGGHRE
jgi:hypothetical protein